MKQNTTIHMTKHSDGELYSLMYSAVHEKDAYVCYLRGRFCTNLSGFFREVSSGMRFPFYFGWNWNAFDECITDLEWLKFSGILIIVDNSDLLFSDEASPTEFKNVLLKHLSIAADYWQSQSIYFSVLLNQP